MRVANGVGLQSVILSKDLNQKKLLLKREENMNFDKLTDFAITVALAAALAGNLDSFTKWVYVAGAKLLYESRTKT